MTSKGERWFGTGVLLRWRKDGGFGFIKPIDGGADVFCHVSQLRHGEGSVKEGDRVRYSLTQDGVSGKRMASNVMLDPGTRLSPSRRRSSRGSGSSSSSSRGSKRRSRRRSPNRCRRSPSRCRRSASRCRGNAGGRGCGARGRGARSESCRSVRSSARSSPDHGGERRRVGGLERSRTPLRDRRGGRSRGRGRSCEQNRGRGQRRSRGRDRS
mmetsp:Transcript_48877/g.113288  ORF Transcript_48877/g.113288 Transcript_48877/m.113288 type:complete len:212 (-) Transcript_48877:149-784(-)